jgi:heme/copper-type cytochrome/quinol oxidase subunit 2
MRVIILGMCALLAAGVLGTMLLSVWSSRRTVDRTPDFRQGIVAELVWAVIPCLMVIAAAIPAAIAIIGARE